MSVKTLPYLLVFRDGKLQPGDPLGLGADRKGIKDITEVLDRLDFLPSQNVGGNGLSYELFEHRDDNGWVVVFGTGGRFCEIVVEQWPDLIELLAKLSTIALAGLISQENDEGERCAAHLPISAVRPEPPPRRKSKH